MNLRNLSIDPYIAAILGMVALASLLPATGPAAIAVDHATNIAITLLFFLYGARLSRDAVLQGIANWRLQLLVLLITYALFPALGLALKPAANLIGPDLYTGLLFLTLLPSTVQSSIAFTSIARGNVPAALCAASLSNIVGVLLTPALVQLVLSIGGNAGVSTGAFQSIVQQLLLPFLAGQLSRPWTAAFVQKHRTLLGYLDRGSILLVVYGAFSEGVVSGIWQRLEWTNLAALALVCSILLAVVIAGTTWLSRALGFATPDEIVIVFCGSKKSLASGIPMANVLFPPHVTGLMVLPLMIFHQIQLMVCAALAQRYARRIE